MIKKILLTIALSVSVLSPALLVTQPAFAVDVINNNAVCNNPDAASKPSFCKDNSTGAANPIYGANGILTAVIKILARVVGFVSVIVIVISGVRMIMSQDSGASANARRGVISAVVGLAIALVAQGLVTFVLSKL